MRTTYRALVGAALLVLSSAGTARADLYLADYPHAKESTCAARFGSQEATCTIRAVGGRDFAVGASGTDGVFRVVLEGPPETPGMPGEEIAGCWILGGVGGCVGGSAYSEAPYPAGTPLVCRAFGMGAGEFECSSFLVKDEEN